MLMNGGVVKEPRCREGVRGKEGFSMWGVRAADSDVTLPWRRVDVSETSVGVG